MAGISKRILLKYYLYVLILMPLKFVPNGPIVPFAKAYNMCDKASVRK